ncbi:hypothetical protein J6590_096360 [Homalodisca vitripennis]|nr:hypothetical protein J6590_096360 [Homalodisca vitripennis]
MIKKVWRGEPEGVRPLGRPRMRWRDQVEKDVRTIGANWKWLKIEEVGETLLARSKTIWVSSGHRSYVRAKKHSLTLNLGTNGLKVTSEPPTMDGQADCLEGQERSAVTHPSISHA